MNTTKEKRNKIKILGREIIQKSHIFESTRTDTKFGTFPIFRFFGFSIKTFGSEISIYPNSRDKISKFNGRVKYFEKAYFYRYGLTPPVCMESRGFTPPV